MASISKHAKGWRAQVARQGVRRSKVFPTRQEAKDWAARQEWEILNGAKVNAEMTLGEVFAKYARERSPSKRSEAWEVLKLSNFQRYPIASMSLGKLTATDFASWRDARLRDVQPATVLREMQLMSSVLNTARKEWRLISENPMTDVSRPKKPPPRDRLPTESEIERLAHAAGSDLNNATARAFHAFLFAIETAMRAGEICALEWADIDLARRVARLHITKNGHPRDVPLSSEAVRLLEALPKQDPAFGLKPRLLDALFRKIKKRAMVVGLTFHDSRHQAITKLSKKLDVLALARMVGHMDLRELRTYYNETAEELAKRLD